MTVVEFLSESGENPYLHKDLSRVKLGFKSVPPQFYFEIAGLAGGEKWREIQNRHEEGRL